MEEVVAYVVMEQVSEPTKPMNLREYAHNNLLYVKFDTVFQSFNIKNRNKRIYDGDAVMDSLAQPHIQELMRKNAWVSEYGHPLDQSMARVTQYDPDRVCGRINSYYRAGNLLKGEFETFDDGALGTVLTRRILQKMEPSFSLRAYAPLSKTADGTAIMKTRAHIVCYDVVILPSHVEAYRDESKAIEICSHPLREASELSQEDLAFVLNESMLTDYVREESKNLKLISNVCEIMKDSLTLSKDLKTMILKEGTDTYHINTDDKIKQDIRNFLTRF